MEQVNPQELYREISAEYVAGLRLEVDRTEKELARIGGLISNPDINAYENTHSLVSGVTESLKGKVSELSLDISHTSIGLEALLKIVRRESQNTQ